MLISQHLKRRSAVHPHGRVDNPPGRHRSRIERGSPPRAWGQSARLQRDFSQPAVHPHGRGDNLRRFCRSREAVGSPPRAWGQLLPNDHQTTCSRFTPTGVGTIYQASNQYARRTVHPHGRGDNVVALPLSRPLLGSPPRAWGQSLGIVDPPAVIRFTPTGVGTIDSQRWGR